MSDAAAALTPVEQRIAKALASLLVAALRDDLAKAMPASPAPPEPNDGGQP